MTEAPVPLHRRDYQLGHPGPVDGVRALDLSRPFAGDALTQLLGDYGAEVLGGLAEAGA